MTKILNDRRLIIKTYGLDRGKRIIQRLQEIEEARDLTDISHFPPARMHRLKGERGHQFAVDVAANWRMVFEAYDSKEEATIDEKKAVYLSIVEIEDYH